MFEVLRATQLLALRKSGASMGLMSTFFVCADLRSSTYHDYDLLERAMRDAGFKTEISNVARSVAFKLPRGIFSFEGNRTDEDVLRLARDVARSVKRPFGLVVVAASSHSVDNLEVAL
ncbi:MAG: hypothetical protein JSS20_16285 [Proteobacteria bacterium]|nr:hypothetical protein [Pseudomonadota bacterium]